eukprot:1756371-Rhodomonas_salina.3
MPGTDAACAATIASSHLGPKPTLRYTGTALPLWSDALAMRSPVLTSAMLLPGTWTLATKS